jgi:hypothetical protein
MFKKLTVGMKATGWQVAELGHEKTYFNIFLKKRYSGQVDAL